MGDPPHPFSVEEYEAALAYMRERDFPADRWIMQSGQEYYRIAEVTGPLHLSDDAVRSLASRGELPGSILHGQQVGWRIARAGIVIYLARQHQEAERRAAG